MPEVHFTVKWPDGEEETCYSPSTVITNYFAAGESYSVTDFLERARSGLKSASDRVEQRYGYVCTSAEAQLARIEQRASPFLSSPNATVDCTAIETRR
ncbi:MAG: MSMEG_0570 family nitrogen starvation response protein [Pseudomonadota bacterium]